AARGILPSRCRIWRRLLSRSEDEASGEIVREFHGEVPPGRRDEARTVAKLVGHEVHDKFPFAAGMRPLHDDPFELIVDNTWRPALAVTGADGIPAVADGGNVLRPKTSLKLSLRLPPTADGPLVARRMKEMLEADPPYGATVTFSPSERTGGGWNEPGMADWLTA